MGYDDDSGNGRDSLLDVELIQGTHYIAVKEFNGGGGEFSVAVVRNE